MNTPTITSNSKFTPNFQARNKIIRDADKICRAVNSRFPHISPTYRTREIASNILNLIEDSHNGFVNSSKAAKDKYLKYEEMAQVYVNANNELEKSRNKRVVNTGVFDYFSKLIAHVRRQGLANCAELAEITLLMCKNKNFDNVKMFSLEAFEEFNPNNLNHANLRDCGCNIEDISTIDLDHVAVTFEHGDKTVVIDPWLGIADYAENYKTKIKSLYKNFFIDLKDFHQLKFQNYDEDSHIESNVLQKLVEKFRSLNIEL